MGGVALAFGGCGIGAMLHHLGQVEDAVFCAVFIGSFLLGGTLCLWSHSRMMRARPRSLHSGGEMTPFIIRDLETEGRYELAYVDQTSGTYSRRLYVERGG